VDFNAESGGGLGGVSGRVNSVGVANSAGGVHSPSGVGCGVDFVTSL
jgi:hypothetical protein